MKKSVIIVAGGSGTRMESDILKQFVLLENRPVLMWTISCFIIYDPSIEIVVVLPESQINLWKELCAKFAFNHLHQVVKGGSTRFLSVKNGLEMIGESDLVAVHDGVRPLVSQDTIDRCFQQAAISGAAIPVLPVNESLRMGTMECSQSVDRTVYYSVQTPQIFRASILKDAYSVELDESFTDDASVVEKNGVQVMLVPGNPENLKVTFPMDLLLAGEYLKKERHPLMSLFENLFE
jgi:2-C-methyl-D-erythritol 4-phosphate cytidylyltransferase